MRAFENNQKLRVICWLQSKHNPFEIAQQCWKSSNNDGRLEFYHVSLLDGRLGVVSWVVFILADLAYNSYTSCHLDGKPAGGGHLWQIRIGHPMVDRDSARTKGHPLAYFEQLEKQVPCAEFRTRLSLKFSKPSCTKNFNGEFYLITHPGEETHDLALPRSSYTWLYSCQLHIHHGKHSPNAPNNVTLIPSLPLPSLTHRDPRTSSESIHP